jgi:Trehalose and maltose hydrolases (possible phosphorylases)
MALDQYVSRTGDTSILKDGGYCLIQQCCLFYQSYATIEDGRLHFLHVIGPDEYHELVDDNAYTNYAIKKCFDIALKYYDDFASGSEVCLDKKALLSLVEKTFLPQPNEEGIIEQFQGYFGLQDSTLEEVRAKVRHANEYLGGPKGVITPTKLIKQADVLSLLLVDPTILEGHLKENFDYYFPKTEHGSSLSSAVYSLAASSLRKSQEAYTMFRKSSGIDLGTNQKVYAGGIYIGGTHPASNAGAYLSAIFGFAGLRFRNGKPECVPSLPDSIREIRFKTYYQRRKFDIRVSRKEVRIKEGK